MLRDIDRVARDSELQLVTQNGIWRYDEDSPHITRFAYDLAVFEDTQEALKTVGKMDGYRIAQDWTVEHDAQLWDEADALDGDIVRYVEALIREVRACAVAFDVAPDVVMAQRISIVRHVEAIDDVSSVNLMRGAVASVAVMDAPVLMLVDPWPMSEERRSPAGKLKGRGQVPQLREIGFMRMLGSRFLWAWNREMSENLMHDYSYEQLLSAKRSGALDDVLQASLSAEVHGDVPKELARAMDLPNPDDFADE